jgi:hypothetical protein
MAMGRAKRPKLTRKRIVMADGGGGKDEQTMDDGASEQKREKSIQLKVISSYSKRRLSLCPRLNRERSE